MDADHDSVAIQILSPINRRNCVGIESFQAQSVGLVVFVSRLALLRSNADEMLIGPEKEPAL